MNSKYSYWLHGTREIFFRNNATKVPRSIDIPGAAVLYFFSLEPRGCGGMADALG